MLFTKHYLVKLILKIWFIIFFITAFGLQFIGKLLKDISYNFNMFDYQNYLIPGLMIFVGCIMLYFINETVEIVK